MEKIQFRYLVYDYFEELIKHNPVGSLFQHNNVINGIVVGHEKSDSIAQNWIIFTCDKPNHKGCCEYMIQQLNCWCEEHGPLCPDLVIYRSHDGEIFLHTTNADYKMDYCPWCGTRLNEAYRHLHQNVED